ncbi:hypothetical protein GJ496_011849 [Pomphorhynchus laevis]|nr:hypothetical protein GJ496_011849 [Pomphorhynchus laevis]
MSDRSPLDLGKNIFKADYIVKHRERNGKKEYLIKWKGWKSSANTWEPESNILSDELLRNYKTKLRSERLKRRNKLLMSTSTSDDTVDSIKRIKQHNCLRKCLRYTTRDSIGRPKSSLLTPIPAKSGSQLQISTNEKAVIDKSSDSSIDKFVNNSGELLDYVNRSIANRITITDITIDGSTVTILECDSLKRFQPSST